MENLSIVVRMKNAMITYVILEGHCTWRVYVEVCPTCVVMFCMYIVSIEIVYFMYCFR